LKLLGTGSALPGAAVGNEELLAALASRCGSGAARRAQRYVNRLGIASRHLSRDLTRGLSGTRPGLEAPALCAGALQQAGADAALSYLIGHTATPHTLLPANIAWVAERMRYDGPYLELRQACTGFANALAISAAMIAEDPSTRIGIVGSETGSPYFDISNVFLDREQLINYVQMGDGAGAVVLAADDGSEREIISDIYCGQSGINKPPGICLEGGGSGSPQCERGLPYFRHRAGDVRRDGEQLILAGVAAIECRGYALSDFDWILPHQANGHMGALVEARFPVVTGKVFVIADRLGNLGSAAIWIALDELRRSGLLLQGQRVLVLGAEASKHLYGGFVYTH
jgi:3-oxoacyl-[acyl-carrier-protein] synthase-3